MSFRTKNKAKSIACAILGLAIGLACVGVTANSSLKPTKELFSDSDLSVVMFWGSWCGNCPAVMQDLEALRTKIDSDKVGFYAVSLDGEQDPHGYLRSRGVGMTSVEEGSSLLKTYDAPGLPWVVIVNSKGEVVDAPSRKVKPAQLAANVELDLHLRGF